MSNSFQSDKQLINKRRRQTFGVSVTAIGWVSMLLGVSGVSSYSMNRIGIPVHLEIPKCSSTASTVSLRRVSRTGMAHEKKSSLGSRSRSRVSTKLMLSMNSNPGSAYETSPPNARIFSSTRLNYRYGDEEDTSEHRHEHQQVAAGLGLGRFWKRDTVSVEEEEKQNQVDEYLEWIDRRYNRLHSDEKESSSKSTWNWLMNSPSNEEEQSTQEDALHVLGLAELASDRLLQKYHLQHQNEAVRSGVVIDTTSSIVSDMTPHQHSLLSDSAVVLSPFVDAGVAVVRTMKSRQKALNRLKREKFRMALRFGIRTIKNVPKSLSRLYKMGGGNKTLSMTFSAAIVFFFIMRPLVVTILQDAVNV